MHERITHVEYDPDFSKLTRKKRVCAYARVSSERDEAFHSLSTQISYYQKKIADHPDWEFVEVFADRGITGTKENREGFQRMLTACREGKVDIVLAKSITRFARNTVILLETVRELRELKVDIHFEEEHIETLSTKGEFMISILAARAQEESRSASENQKWRIQKSYEKGIPVTGNCLGYRMVDHEFLIDEEEEQIVLRIFSMYLSGMGKYAIAKKLNEEGVPSRLGRKWSHFGIGQILTNEKYVGDLRLQKWFISDYVRKKKMINHGEKPSFYVTDNHDPIITRETFDAVQKEIAHRVSNGNYHRTVEHYPFTSLIRCGLCGKHYCRRTANSSTKYAKPVWMCEISYHFGQEVCAATYYIPEYILESKTCEALNIPEFDSSILRKRIAEIVAPEKNVLVYVFKDGTEKRVEWQHRSRRESWTPEMKETARQKAIEQHKKKGGNNDGS